MIYTGVRRLTFHSIADRRMDGETPGGSVTSSSAGGIPRSLRHATDASPAAACFWKSLPPLSASALYGL